MDSPIHSLIAISLLALLCTASAIVLGHIMFALVFAAEFVVALDAVIRLSRVR
jgi:hypothetical protein